MTSSSTTDARAAGVLPAGTELGAYRIDGVRRRRPGAVTYEATQVPLGRRAVLTLHDGPGAGARAREAARREAALHHPALVSVIETGDSASGTYVVRRDAGDRALSAVLARRGSAQRRERLLADLEDGLAVAHAAGLVAGGLPPGRVVVEGDRAQITELELPRGDLAAAVEEDLRALARLRGARGARAEWRGRSAPAAVAVGAAFAGAAVAVVAGSDGAAVPAPAPGTMLLGSTLATAGEATGCDGRPPHDNAAPCTVAAAGVDGRPVVVPADGVVRGWAVRGARGRLALQVLRRAPGGAYVEVSRSQVEPEAGEDPVRHAAAVPVRRGDLLAVELASGAALPGAGAAPLRWIGPLRAGRAPRAPEPETAAPADAREAVALRVELERGAVPEAPPQLTGSAARAARPGTVLAQQTLELAGGQEVVVAVVRTGATVALDLVRGGVRRARITVPDADPRGRLDVLEQGFTASDYVRVQWLAPGAGIPLQHGYTVRPDRFVVRH